MEPAFSWMNKLSAEVKTAIKHSKVLFCNGYGFDELSPALIISALEYAAQVGTSIFFDPGPRGKSLSSGTPEEQRALSYFLSTSDVLLLTSDEVYLSLSLSIYIYMHYESPSISQFSFLRFYSFILEEETSMAFTTLFFSF